MDIRLPPIWLENHRLTLGSEILMDVENDTITIRVPGGQDA